MNIASHMTLMLFKGARFLRIPEEYRQSTEDSKIYIKALRKQFPFMVIAKHFDESLVVLKRFYCWDLEDIVYVPLKVSGE